ncbi:hypothetical protein TB1_024911 [Malus domestica]
MSFRLEELGENSPIGTTKIGLTMPNTDTKILGIDLNVLSLPASQHSLLEIVKGCTKKNDLSAVFRKLEMKRAAEGLRVNSREYTKKAKGEGSNSGSERRKR